MIGTFRGIGFQDGLRRGQGLDRLVDAGDVKTDTVRAEEDDDLLAIADDTDPKGRAAGPTRRDGRLDETGDPLDGVPGRRRQDFRHFNLHV